MRVPILLTAPRAYQHTGLWQNRSPVRTGDQLEINPLMLSWSCLRPPSGWVELIFSIIACSHSGACQTQPQQFHYMEIHPPMCRFVTMGLQVFKAQTTYRI